MRYLFLLFVVLLSCNQSDHKTAPTVPARSQHSGAFNGAVDTLMDRYQLLTEAFVNWDSAALPELSASVLNGVEQVQQASKKDSTIDYSRQGSYLDSARQILARIGSGKNITSQRHGLNDLSDNLMAFLDVVHYDREKLFLQQCPMAFNDEETGTWISRADSIRNPYLGLHHPRYGKGMLECGETKKVLDYTGSR